LTGQSDGVTKVLFVRHAEPFVSGETSGAEWPLTARGSNEARALGTRLAHWPAVAIWTSPERRARETAAQTFPTVVAEVRSQLSEVHKPWYDSSEAHANDVVNYLRGDVVAGWEPRAAVIARIAQLQSGFRSFDRIVLVSHGLFITTWLDNEMRLADPFVFWSNLQMPDAWELDLDERSFRRIP
jgi:probable phosphoglycerate mutase